MTTSDGNRKEDGKERKTTVSEQDVKRSLALHFVRHAESANNEVYRNARYIYRGGTPDFDEAGWNHYVDTQRQADPTLSTKGFQQTKLLADYLIPHLSNQVSSPIRIVTSPMRRTLETIRPTLEGLQRAHGVKVHLIVCAFYHESEGCHLKDKAEEGMNPAQIREFMKNCIQSPSDLEFVGFPDMDRGWYVNGKGPETRVESEIRAAKFYMWLCEHFDAQLMSSSQEQQQGEESTKHGDVFDAGVLIKGEEDEDENDKHASRIRRRRAAWIVGHGDFMSLVLKRLIAGFGHAVELEGIPHRSAFTHFNTGMSEFEYFGHGRFLCMGTNQTPHFQPHQYTEMRSGGSLKDGWSYVVPADEVVLNAEVSVAFEDELEDHVREQTVALKALYLSSKESEALQPVSNDLQVEEEEVSQQRKECQFIVKRGLQVVGVATYCDETGQLKDVAIRPTAADDRIGETLMDAVKQHARKLRRSTSLIVHPRSQESMSLFQTMGFSELNEDDDDTKMATSID